MGMHEKEHGRHKWKIQMAVEIVAVYCGYQGLLSGWPGKMLMLAMLHVVPRP